MSVTAIVWGTLSIVGGVFFSIYGYTLFRFVLAGIGFLIGFSIAMPLLASQPDMIRIVLGVVAGGIVGAVLYFLISFSLYIAGALLGLVIAMLVASFLLVLRLDGVVLNIVLALAGLGLGAFFGRRLGDLIIILATAGIGAYTVVYGLGLWFPEQFNANVSELNGLLPISGFSLVLLIAIALISGLAQYQILDLRRRLRN